MKTIGLEWAHRLAMPVFWATTLFVFTLAVMPASHGPRLMPWDKAEHFSAFFVLMGLGSAAFAKRPLWLIGLCLSGFGALIEIVQAFVGRDCDVFDWVADSVGVLAVIAPTALPWWRAMRRPPSPDETAHPASTAVSAATTRSGSSSSIAG